MRTTLNIDDDVLSAAKRIAERERKSAGKVLSELARQTLDSSVSFGRSSRSIPLLPVRPNAEPVTLEHVNNLRDEPDEGDLAS